MTDRTEQDLTTTATSDDPLELAGTVLDGRYRIDDLVGEGGFGAVYRAFHIGFKAPVAVKLLKISPSLTSGDRNKLLSTFDEEGRLMFLLAKEHPAFVQVLEKGVLEREGRGFAPYLVLEWLDGHTLEQDLSTRRHKVVAGRSLASVIELLGPIAEALGVAHDRKIAHRDVKPANIFLLHGLRTTSSKLLDLGIAKVMTSTGTDAFRDPTTGGIGGFTLRYGAPEQWHKKYGATGPWTDVYALALVCVEMLTGQPAIEGDEPSQLLGATLDPERPTPLARGTSVEPPVELVFKKALAINPQDRYRTARDFWTALQAAHSTLLSDARSTTVRQGPLIGPTSARTSQLPRDRSRLASAAMLIGSALFSGLLAYYVGRLSATSAGNQIQSDGSPASLASPSSADASAAALPQVFSSASATPTAPTGGASTIAVVPTAAASSPTQVPSVNATARQSSSSGASKRCKHNYEVCRYDSECCHGSRCFQQSETKRICCDFGTDCF